MNEALKLKKATYHLWTFTISKLISAFGAQVYAFAISFYILQATGSATSFAANLICNILPRTIAAPFAGYFIDNYSRKKIVIFSQIATTLAIGSLLIFSITSGLSLAAIYTTSCVLSLTSMFSGVAFSSSITGLVDQNRIQKAMSLNQMSISFASIGSPAVGGLLYGAVSMPTFLILYMTASILAVLLEMTMNFSLFSSRNPEEDIKEPMWQSMRSGIAYIKTQSLLMTVIWIALLINFFFGAYQVGYSFILIEKLKIASKQFGLTEGAFAAGMLLLSIYFTVRKEVKSPLKVSKWGIIGMGVIMAAIVLPLILTFQHNLIFGYYIILQLGLGTMSTITNTPIMVILQKQIDDRYKGRVFSILETMAMALMPLGMVLYGFLYDVFPAHWIMIVSSFLFVSVILVLARPSVIRRVHPEMNNKNAVMMKKVPSSV
ncbi:MFS transporter [Neobacillus kokaensis]|uniref:MFS transporter n=1 Tax=Neobacillus kokaensis TaxID=2759023 RepID=A0ABQ3N650_9BACI|nr:MFS transporter [Neobacillus kokaensis]GHI00188.1 MFS transporter [Neobacillus kokaensis]